MPKGLYASVIGLLGLSLLGAAYVVWASLHGATSIMVSTVVLVSLVASIAVLTMLWQHMRRTVERLSMVDAALRRGSKHLAAASTPNEVIQAGVEMLQQLNLAPNLAYIAYHQGSPQVVAGDGAFAALIGRPIFPKQRDSRSVQADHWVVEGILMHLPRNERMSDLVAGVYGYGDRHVGNIILTRPSGEPFSEDDKETLVTFSRLLGAQLGQFQVIKELEEAQDLSLKALGNMLEHRDNETAGHTSRVVSLSLRLGKALGWSEQQLVALRWGAYLHDIGKIATPDAILRKPGRLTTAERQIMEDHARVGYDLLQNLHFLPAGTLDLVRYHHERWNGQGYPAGLRGKEIPETARIFAIVDVYDALTSTRPYKRAWTMEEALTEMQSQAGKHFDPDYMQVFSTMLREDGGERLLEQ